jgi:hypothetical protein
MTTVTDIAQRILDENNYTVGDFGSLTNVEYLVKNAVDYVNLMADVNISFTPVAGSEDLTASDSEIITVKFATVLLLRAYHDRGPNTSVAGLAVTSLVGDPQYSFYSQALKLALDRLMGRSFEAV